MKLKKILTILFLAYSLLLLGLIIANNAFLFIDDQQFWLNVVVASLIFIVIFYVLGLILANNYEKKIIKLDKAVDVLKGKLYDAIKDDEEREKMLKDFEKSLK